MNPTHTVPQTQNSSPCGLRPTMLPPNKEATQDTQDTNIVDEPARSVMVGGSVHHYIKSPALFQEMKTISRMQNNFSVTILFKIYIFQRTISFI